MNPVTFRDIASTLGTEPLQFSENSTIETLLTDSRRLIFAENTLFFALSTSQRDASQFIPGLYNQGVRNFVVSEEFNTATLKRFPEANFISVPHVLPALQQIAAVHRNQFQIPVIGITGSNGKTIVKEWLYQLLNKEYNIVRSPKSYNSQVGVPLSVWQINDSHSLGIFEAGISKPGEMKLLQKIIQPDIGIFTFSGEAHAEGFKNNLEKIREKMLLFTSCHTLIYCMDETVLDKTVRSNLQTKTRLFTWSTRGKSNLQVLNIEKSQGESYITCSYKKKKFIFSIGFTDDASIHNAITCCCAMLVTGIPEEIIPYRMRQLRPVEMRLELKQGIHNCSIINDSYSADLDSLGIAIDFLVQQQQHPRRTLILSDVLQSGKKPEALYKSIASIIKQKRLFRFIGVGPQISEHADAFKNIESHFFDSTDALLQALPDLHFRDETILLKGARVFHFEKISRSLEQKLHDTVMEIDLQALRHNFKMYQQLLSKEVKIMAMVKAFSYGSGSHEIASLLQHTGADYLAVAYADEGVELRKTGIRLPIMVMNTEAAGFDNIVQHDLEPELFSFNILEAFTAYLEEQAIDTYPVHIKLDTGMHRLGFEQPDIRKLVKLLANNRRLNVRSVFSHLAASSDPKQAAFTMRQADLFRRQAKQIEKGIGYTFLKHIGNTSAVINKSLQMDMVRLGIGLYGVDDNMSQENKLKNVTTLKTTISQVRLVKKGDSVGYGRHAIVKKDTMIATVRIGYADGYPRILGNGNGKMMVKGKLARVVGNVCMDMTMIDVTGRPVLEEDEVIVFGNDLPVSQVAKWASTISYEILTNISQRVRRLYFEE